MADVGHFGVRPIRIAWFSLVMPGLFLNYLGQGALVLRETEKHRKPILSVGPSLGAISARGFGHGGRSNRVTSPHFWRIFIDHSSHSTWVFAASIRQTHVLQRARPDLPAPCELGADAGLHWPGAGFPVLHQYGFRLRHRGNTDDAFDDCAVLFCFAPFVGLEYMARGAGLQSILCRWKGPSLPLIY